MSWGRKRWRSDGLTRYERGMNIDPEDVESWGDGHWNVHSSQSREDYDVERLRFRCSRRECVSGQLCGHRYTCSCPDSENPCKHIYRVHSLDRARKPPKPTAAELEEAVTRDRVALRGLVTDLGDVIGDPTLDVNIAGDLKSALTAALGTARRSLRRPPRDLTDVADTTADEDNTDSSGEDE